MPWISNDNRNDLDVLKQGYDRLNPMYKFFFPSDMKPFLDHYQIPAQPGGIDMPPDQFESLNRLYRRFLNTGRFRRWLFSCLTLFSNTAGALSLGPWMNPASDNLGGTDTYSVEKSPVSQNFYAMMASEKPFRLAELLQSIQSVRGGKRRWMNQFYSPIWTVASGIIRSVCIKLAEITSLTHISFKDYEGDKITGLHQVFHFIEDNGEITAQDKLDFYELVAKHRAPDEINQCIKQLRNDELFTIDNFRYCMMGTYPLFRWSTLNKLNRAGQDTPENRQTCAAASDPHFMADCLIYLNKVKLLDRETRALIQNVPNTNLSYFYYLLEIFPGKNLTRQRFDWLVAYASHEGGLLRDTLSLWEKLVRKHSNETLFNRDIDALMIKIGDPKKTLNLSASSVYQHFRDAGHIQNPARPSRKRRTGFLDQATPQMTEIKEDDSSSHSNGIQLG